MSPICHSGELSLEYIQDEAQEVAKQLINFEPLTSSSHQDILREFCPEKRISSEMNHLEQLGTHWICDPKELFPLESLAETEQGHNVCEQQIFSQSKASGTPECVPEHRHTVGQHSAADEKITQALANLHFLGWDSLAGQEKQGQSFLSL